MAKSEVEPSVAAFSKAYAANKHISFVQLFWQHLSEGLCKGSPAFLSLGRQIAPSC